MLKNSAGKGENADFQKPSFSVSLKVGIVR